MEFLSVFPYITKITSFWWKNLNKQQNWKSTLHYLYKDRLWVTWNCLQCPRVPFNPITSVSMPTKRSLCIGRKSSPCIRRNDLFQKEITLLFLISDLSKWTKDFGFQVCRRNYNRNTSISKFFLSANKLTKV